MDVEATRRSGSRSCDGLNLEMVSKHSSKRELKQGISESFVTGPFHPLHCPAFQCYRI